MSVRLVEITRGDIVESEHWGDIAVINSKGEVLYQLGDINKIVYLRSASKPFQLISALQLGLMEKFQLDHKEIALMTSSHSGETEHLRILKVIMDKINIKEEDLECGIHEPLGVEAHKQLVLSGKKATKFHCNCSGKHLSLIAAAILKGLNIENYSSYEHPIQKDAEKVIADFSGVKAANIIKGIDGCGVPVFAVPLYNAALAFANIGNENFMEGKYKKSQQNIISAMTKYPEMVAGTNRIDTILMKQFGDRIVSKIGTEGIYCVGLIGKAIGIALKISDGNSRAVGPTIIEVLRQMKVIKKIEAEKVIDFWHPDIENHRGEKVGKIMPRFTLTEIPYKGLQP